MQSIAWEALRGLWNPEEKGRPRGQGKCLERLELVQERGDRPADGAADAANPSGDRRIADQAARLAYGSLATLEGPPERRRQLRLVLGRP